ncbi:hypothetical protein JCM6882_008435 [Rhodosporidiobolus microsporus]
MPLPPPVSSQSLHRSRSNGALPVSPSPSSCAPPAAASSSGSRVKLRLATDRALYVAGQTVTGTLEVDVKIKKGAQVALGDLGCELAGLAELRSRTHTSTRRLLTQRLDFQGSGRPPSSAVVPHSLPLQGSFYPALPGRTRFAFSFTLPVDAPSSCTLGNGTATTRYELRAFAHALVDGNVDIRSESAVVTVVERWADWRKGAWAVEGGVEKKAAERLALGGDGKVEMKASVGRGEWAERPPRLFWRRDKESGVEGKGAVRVEVHVRNASKRHVTGLKLTLLRRLRLLPAPGQAAPPSGDDAPTVVSSIVTERFHGIDYDVASSSERDVQLAMQVPPDTECWSVRRAGLFEIDCVVRVEVECGFLAKNLFVDLPIWIAHPLSLPNSAHRFVLDEQRRLGLVAAPSPATSAQLPLPPLPAGPGGGAGGVPYHRPVSPLSSIAGIPHSPSHSNGGGYYPYPASNPNSPSAADFATAAAAASQLPLPLPGSPGFPSPAGLHSPASPGQGQPAFNGGGGGYAESAISLSPSVSSPAFYHPPASPAPPHFGAPPPPPPSLSQVAHYHPSHPAAECAAHHVHPHSHDASRHGGGYVHFDPSAPDLTPSRFLGGVLSTHQPTHIAGSAIPSAPASEVGVAVPLSPAPPVPCPSPAPSAAPSTTTVPPPPTHAQVRHMLPHLPPHEQMHVLERVSTPVAAYSAMDRAHEHPRTASRGGVSYSPERGARGEHYHHPQQQRDLPLPPPPPQSSPPRTCPSPVPSVRPSRAAHTPPPPSPSSGSAIRRSPSPAPSPSRSPAFPASYTPAFPDVAASLLANAAASVAGLETIGEDGESQAGTAKSAMVGREAVEALRREGEEHARREEEEERAKRQKQEKQEKENRRRSVAEELEQWAEREDEERAKRENAVTKEKSLPPLPPPTSPSPSTSSSRPSARDVFPTANAALPAKAPSPAPPPRRDPSGLSALEARLLARSPSPSKPSSPSFASPPPPSFPSSSASPALPASTSSALAPSSSPNLAAPAELGPSALRARSLSRASRLQDDDELRRRIEEAEKDPGAAVRRAREEMGWYATGTAVEESKKAEEVVGEVEPLAKEDEEEEQVVVEAKPVKRALPTRPASYIAPTPSMISAVPAAAPVSPRSSTPSSPKPTRPVFSSSNSSYKRHTLPALPVSESPLALSSPIEVPQPAQPTEQPFVPPEPVAALSPPASASAPVAVLKRGSSPVARTAPNPWSKGISAAPSPFSRRDVSPSRALPPTPQPAPSSAAAVPPVSPIDASGRKIVDRPELKGLKRDAVNRITGWLKDNGVDPSSPAGASVTYLGEEEGDLVRSPSFVSGLSGNMAGDKSRKRRTIEFGRLAPAPPSSSSVGGSSPLLGGASASSKTSSSSTNLTSLSGASAARPSHKHSLSVPTTSSLPPSSASPAEPTVAQLLAAETRAAMRQARIGSPPPWSPSGAGGAGKSAVEKGTEGYLAALKRDEEGAVAPLVDGYERSARKLKQSGKVTSVVGIWAGREEEAAREGTASPPLPPLPTGAPRRHHKSAKSLSFLPHSATSPSLSSSASTAGFSPLSASHGAKPLTSVGNSPARLSARESSSPSAPRAAPAKPFLNTTLGKPSSSNGGAALRVPSGGAGKMPSSESAPALASAAAGKAPLGGARVKDLLARYQQQVAQP